MSANNLSPSENCYNLIKESEGCVLTAYQDVTGVWTIGYGFTSSVIAGGVHQGMTITQDQADQLLTEVVQPFAAHINQVVEVELTQNQFDALVDYTYNLGTANLDESTLLKDVNEGDFAQAAQQFPLWVLAGGTVQPGLVTRRQREQTLFETA